MFVALMENGRGRISFETGAARKASWAAAGREQAQPITPPRWGSTCISSCMTLLSPLLSPASFHCPIDERGEER